MICSWVGEITNYLAGLCLWKLESGEGLVAEKGSIK